jgi:ATP-dependent RNA helicase RhlE
MSTFAELDLSSELLRVLNEQDYETPTPIQAAAIPPALLGRDVLGCAQTGTGKTAGFGLPLLQRLMASPRQGQGIRALILAPTRELVTQIHESLCIYGKYSTLRFGVVMGGAAFGPQQQMLRRGVDVLIATPGRLLDHMQQGTVRLNAVEIFVLDEADRMLDMGFIAAIRRIHSVLPQKRQTLFFSATMPSDVQHLADKMLNNPARIEVSKRSSVPTSVKQIVHPVHSSKKQALLQHLLQRAEFTSVIVFTRTKHGANKLAVSLQKCGHTVTALHGNKSQGQRQRALADFKEGKARILVATDVAARGLDVDGVSHVINYEVPNIAESYVHRIGRTGRASGTGQAISLMSSDERPYIQDIEKLTGTVIEKIPVTGFEGGGPEPVVVQRGGRSSQRRTPTSGTFRPQRVAAGRR